MICELIMDGVTNAPGHPMVFCHERLVAQAAQILDVGLQFAESVVELSQIVEKTEMPFVVCELDFVPRDEDYTSVVGGIFERVTGG